MASQPASTPTPSRRDSMRVHPRIEFELEVNMLSESNFYMGFAENLSEGGLFLATHKVHPVGTKVELTFKLPSSDVPIRVKGEVRWRRDYSVSSDAPPGIGVRFEDLTDPDAAKVREFLRARAPLFFEE